MYLQTRNRALYTASSLDESTSTSTISLLVNVGRCSKGDIARLTAELDELDLVDLLRIQPLSKQSRTRAEI
jgi:hypothetical protein